MTYSELMTVRIEADTIIGPNNNKTRRHNIYIGQWFLGYTYSWDDTKTVRFFSLMEPKFGNASVLAKDYASFDDFYASFKEKR